MHIWQFSDQVVYFIVLYHILKIILYFLMDMIGTFSFFGIIIRNIREFSRYQSI